MSVIQHNIILSQDASGRWISQRADPVVNETHAYIPAPHGQEGGVVQNNVIVHNAASGHDIDQAQILLNVDRLVGPVPHGFTVQNNIIQANDASGANIHQVGQVSNHVEAGRGGSSSTATKYSSSRHQVDDDASATALTSSHQAHRDARDDALTSSYSGYNHGGDAFQGHGGNGGGDFHIMPINQPGGTVRNDWSRDGNGHDYYNGGQYNGDAFHGQAGNGGDFHIMPINQPGGTFRPDWSRDGNGHDYFNGGGNFGTGNAHGNGRGGDDFHIMPINYPGGTTRPDWHRGTDGQDYYVGGNGGFDGSHSAGYHHSSDATFVGGDCSTWAPTF
ncbi:hypothetical protein H9P43_006930 [Blastocladiella emersonii ATCC 22665]|nr:hypothetical protein H9P43_006930 [Blastocladiella emersonii ATCC 22665]